MATAFIYYIYNIEIRIFICTVDIVSRDINTFSYGL